MTSVLLARLTGPGSPLTVALAHHAHTDGRMYERSGSLDVSVRQMLQKNSGIIGRQCFSLSFFFKEENTVHDLFDKNSLYFSKRKESSA